MTAVGWQWAVLWAHASAMTMDEHKVLSDYPSVHPFQLRGEAQAWAGPIARAGGFAYTLVRRPNDAAPWLTVSGHDPLHALRFFRERGHWPGPERVLQPSRYGKPIEDNDLLRRLT